MSSVEKDVRENWIQIKEVGKATDDTMVTIFLNGEIFINPKYVEHIENAILGHRLSKGKRS